MTDFLKHNLERARRYAGLIRQTATQVEIIRAATQELNTRIDAVHDRIDGIPDAPERPLSQELSLTPPSLPAEFASMNDEKSEEFARAIIERTLYQVRQEYTVMPRFGFHQPLDYYMDTFPKKFDNPIIVEGELLPLPPAPERMGYSADNEEYLNWGRDDKNLLMEQISKHSDLDENVAIFDFGCSSGRVLRHFYPEVKEKGWSLYGSDVQAHPIQWMREYFPDEFNVFTGTTMPYLPFEDNSFDVIYGFSIFTHIKYHWDMWLLELRRVLKPGGILIQTIHTENAWKFYYENKNEDWVKDNHSAKMLETKDMPHDYFYYGDMSVSQVFWKRDVARKYWQRYFTVLDVLPPPDHRSFQDWMICRKPK